jgi:hypothetical protein
MRRLLSVGALVAVILAGCGGSDDSAGSAENVVESYVDAQSARDFQQVCELFSDQFRQQFRGASCAGFLEEQSSGIPRRQFKVVSVTENGDQATARLQTGGESGKPVNLKISLVRQDGAWRITSIGGASPD